MLLHKHKHTHAHTHTHTSNYNGTTIFRYAIEIVSSNSDIGKIVSFIIIHTNLPSNRKHCQLLQ